MPVSSLADAPASIRELEGGKLTLAQVNWILGRFDELEDKPGLESPFAVAVSEFKDKHKRKGDGWVEKGRPTASDVHRPASMRVVDDEIEEKDDVKAESARTRWRGSALLVKADVKRRIVYGVVLKPRLSPKGEPVGDADTQGHRARAEEIEKAAHDFMKRSRQHDAHHRDVLPLEKACPVESYLAPQDLVLDGKSIPAGSWVMAVHVPDDELWAEVESGEINAFSIRGWGKSRPVG